jgi:glycerophosphoryl diester phosphodiesterase
MPVGLQREITVVAHRGASMHFPENSIAAFRAAAEQGADAVELDVRLTADGVLVVSHDAFVGGAAQNIGSRRYDEIAADVASFDEVAAACDGLRGGGGEPLGLVIELKCDPGDADHDPGYPICASVVEAVGARVGLGPRTMITSFDEAALKLVKELEPSLSTGLLELDPRDPAATQGRATALSCDAVLAFGGLLTAPVVDRCHEVGLAMYVWTVDLPEHQQHFLDLGVDGLLTNDPATARGVVRAWTGATSPASTNPKEGNDVDLDPAG